MRSEEYLHRIFRGAFEGDGNDTEGPGLRSADSVKGQFLREWEEHLVILADGNPVMEKELRKMDHFSFLNRILALNKKAKAEESAQVRAENSFGRKQ